jgi:hypothetical protein
MGQFMTRALENGLPDRVKLYGMQKPDILFYLDPTFFGLTLSWIELQDEFGDGPASKPWTIKKYGTDFNLTNVRQAAEALDQIPRHPPPE